MNKLVFLLILLITSISTSAQSDEWIRVQSDNEEFSIEIPNNYQYFYDKDGFDYGTSQRSFDFTEMKMLNSSFEKTVMSVEIYKTDNPKDYLSRLAEGIRFRDSSKRNYKQDVFSIREYQQKKIKDAKNEIAISHITRFIASKTHLYVITVANRGSKSTSFEKFLSSIRLGTQTINRNEKIINISSIKPITITDVFEDGTKTNTPRPITNPKAEVNKTEKDDFPALFLVKPFAAYTDAARNNQSSGRLRLQIVFEKNGGISKIIFLEPLPDGLNRSAFFAALRIKFIPSEKDGEFKTVKKQVEYTFTLF